MAPVLRLNLRNFCSPHICSLWSKPVPSVLLAELFEPCFHNFPIAYGKWTPRQVTETCLKRKWGNSIFCRVEPLLLVAVIYSVGSCLMRRRINLFQLNQNHQFFSVLCLLQVSMIVGWRNAVAAKSFFNACLGKYCSSALIQTTGKYKGRKYLRASFTTPHFYWCNLNDIVFFSFLHMERSNYTLSNFFKQKWEQKYWMICQGLSSKHQWATAVLLCSALANPCRRFLFV
jgi:hypothetical protein